MAVYLMTVIKNFIGASGDSKPTDVAVGSTFFEYDTNLLYVTYDGTNWIAKQTNDAIKSTTIDLHQAAASYDLFTATSGAVFIENVVFQMPTSPNVADDATITSISIQTNDSTPMVILSATAGAKANLVVSAQFSYSTPFALSSAKKIQLTIAGGASDAATVCTVIAKYRAITSGAYLA